MTVIDAAHPLSAVDLALDTALTELTPKILESYLKAKHLPASNSHEFEFEPVGFTTQTVAGTNYYVKMLVHDKCHTDKHTREYIHIRIFVQVWTNTIQLTGLSVDKHEGDSLRDPITDIVE
ncbi:hypothetical protein BGZ80_004630 [Entomortierella chlamydospora]|uniref:Cystatin domain-containing protein n=1 Tax=Entomortierella chlamydospora TaxID=101097 RepID=A0A9P6N1C7_9FUNG|nr:hypothetical protein BGZ80_004630 [Entomortierella chlamydospora]